ncbi:YggS family pyridoxal phosphate enzyme, partial [Staphylococcus caprae]
MREVKDNLAQINLEINEHREKSNISTQPNVIAVTKYVT